MSSNQMKHLFFHSYVKGNLYTDGLIFMSGCAIPHQKMVDFASFVFCLLMIYVIKKFDHNVYLHFHSNLVLILQGDWKTILMVVPSLYMLGVILCI